MNSRDAKVQEEFISWIFSVFFFILALPSKTAWWFANTFIFSKIINSTVKEKISRVIWLSYFLPIITFITTYLLGFLILIYILDQISDKEPIFKNGLLICSPLLLCDLFAKFLNHYINDEETRAIHSGIVAEKTTFKKLRSIAKKTNGAYLIKSSLLGQRDASGKLKTREYDAIFVIYNTVFCIEVKYKSAQVIVDLNEHTWRTISIHGEGEMVNALKQSQAASAFLKRIIGDSMTIIPVVAFVGNTEIFHGPSNVLNLSELEQFISAFKSLSSNNPEVLKFVIQKIKENQLDKSKYMKYHKEHVAKKNLEATTSKIKNSIHM